MKLSECKCRRCGVASPDCKGWLERINKGELPPIWECRPSCDATLSDEQKIISAIEGDAPHEH